MLELKKNKVMSTDARKNSCLICPGIEELERIDKKGQNIRHTQTEKEVLEEDNLTIIFFFKKKKLIMRFWPDISKQLQHMAHVPQHE